MAAPNSTDDKTVTDTEMAIHNETVQPVNTETKADANCIPDEYRELDNGDVAVDALGGTVHDLPPGYYRSFGFIGTITALCLGQISCYFGFVMPANVLTIINEDIGPNANYVWIALIVSVLFPVALTTDC